MKGLLECRCQRRTEMADSQKVSTQRLPPLNDDKKNKAKPRNRILAKEKKKENAEEENLEGSSEEEKLKKKQKGKGESRGRSGSSDDTDSKAPRGSIKRLNCKEILDNSERNYTKIKHKLKGLQESVRHIKSFNDNFKVKEIQEEDIQVLIGMQKPSTTKKINLNPEEEKAYKEMRILEELLKRKCEEEKDAKLRRMEEQQEICQELEECLLQEEYDICDSIKLNSRQFIKLLTDDPTTPEQGDEKKQLEDSFERRQEEFLDQVEDLNLKNKEKPINGKFIERNIQLAKCGKGILSLTDDEKLKIEDILKEDDVDEQEGAGQNEANKPIMKTNYFSLNGAVSGTLDDLSEKLKVYEEVRRSEVFPEVKSSEERESTDGEEEEEKKKFKNSTTRLKELDKLLQKRKAPSSEEVEPLSVEDLHILIEEAKHWNDLYPKNPCKSSVSKESILDLVAEAQVLMPNYKYKFYRFHE